MKAVILAGGRGSRLEEESVTRPKPLVEIGDHPILWHILNIYSANGINDFVICAGYKGYLIKEYFSRLALHHSDITVRLADNQITYHNVQPLDWTVTVVDTGLNSATGGRVRRVAHHLSRDEPFCLTYGDGVADIDIRKLIAQHRTMGGKVTMTTVVPPARFGAVETEGNTITAFAEKPIATEGRINGGFFVVEPSVLDLIASDATVWESDILDGLARSGDLRAYRHDGFWQPMDTIREKMTLETLWATGRAPWKMWK